MGNKNYKTHFKLKFCSYTVSFRTHMTHLFFSIFNTSIIDAVEYFVDIPLPLSLLFLFTLFILAIIRFPMPGVRCPRCAERGVEQ